MNFHIQTEEIRRVLTREGIRHLYHFTDIYNLPTIGKYGILTKKELEEKDALKKIKTGGNTLSKQLDLRHGNWDKVSLSWCPKIPMIYYREQEQHLCYLVLDLNLALMDGVYFTDVNATESGNMRDLGLQGLSLVDFNCVRHDYPYPNRETKRRKQAEVLIPFSINTQWIKRVSFRSESSLKEAKRRCKIFSDFACKFNIDEDLFILPSAYVKNHLITTTKPSKDISPNWNLRNNNLFCLNEVIFVVVEIGKLTSDTEILLHINDTLLDKRIIRARGDVIYYKDLPTDNPGIFTITYYIKGQKENIYQFRERIEVVENDC